MDYGRSGGTGWDAQRAHVTPAWCWVVLLVPAVSFVMVACLLVRADFSSSRPHMWRTSLRAPRSWQVSPAGSRCCLSRSNSRGPSSRRLAARIVRAGSLSIADAQTGMCWRPSSCSVPLWSLGSTDTQPSDGFSGWPQRTLRTPSHWPWD
jgi:hypothetical protein